MSLVFIFDMVCNVRCTERLSEFTMTFYDFPKLLRLKSVMACF